MAKLGATDISIMDVRNILGYPSIDLGILCTCNKINCWSKWKPIHCANTLTLTEGLLKSNSYGIEIVSSNTPSSLVTSIKANNNLGYKYIRPKGGSFSPYRLGDFRNYYHNAQIPVNSFYSDGNEIKIGGITSSNHGSYETMIDGLLVPEYPDETEQYFLSKDMIYNFIDNSGNKIPLTKGVYFTDGTNSCWYSGKAYYWTTEFQKFNGKTIEVYEFYTNAIRTPTNPWTASADDRFYAIPVPYHTVSVSNQIPAGSRKVSVLLKAMMSNDKSEVTYELQFSAKGDVYSGGTLKNVWIVLAKDSKGVNMIERVKISDSLTINNGTSSIKYEGSFYNRNLETILWVLVYYDDNIQYTGVPMMDPTAPEI